MEAPRNYSRGRNVQVHGVDLLADARVLIQTARSRGIQSAQDSLVDLYWSLGRRLRWSALQESRAQRPERLDSLVATLSRALSRLYGRSYSQETLRRMLRFAERYPTPARRRALLGLRWGHVVALAALDEPRERDFYAQACRHGAWSPQVLRERIKGLYYARCAGVLKTRPGGPRKPAPDLPGDGLFHDPDFADFLGCAGSGPRDRRGAVIKSMEDYVVGLEAGFCFVERWKRFQVGSEDFYLDLVLYHRRLRCLFALVFDFRSGPAPRKDLMDFYLTWLNQHERQSGEQPPVGILFQAEGGLEALSLRQLDRESARVAWYQTGLPPRVLLHQFFLQAVAAAGLEAS